MSLSLPNSASVDNAKASRKAPRVIGGKVRQWVLKNPWRAAGLAVFLTLSLATATLSTAVYQLYALPLPTRAMAPTMAAKSTSEAISNGNANGPKSALPISERLP